MVTNLLDGSVDSCSKVLNMAAAKLSSETFKGIILEWYETLGPAEKRTVEAAMIIQSPQQQGGNDHV